MKLGKPLFNTSNVSIKHNQKQLIRDTDYEVTYKNNTLIGTAQAIIKGIMCILYFPLTLCIAIIYPLIKRKDLSWAKRWWKYATTWKKGFYSGYIYKLWEVED